MFKPRKMQDSKSETKTVKSKADPKKNKHLDNGKIHVEHLYDVFDLFRRNMANAVYATNPFLQERKVFELRQKLRTDLEEMGFGEYIDFSFVPMPPAVTSGITQKDLTESPHKKSTKPSKKPRNTSEDDEDEDD